MGDEPGIPRDHKALKNQFIWVSIFLVLSISGGQAFPDHRIVSWPGNREGAVSLTFDDGCPSQRLLGFGELERRGYRGTFFLVSGSLPGGWNGWKKAALSGHEIGSHTVSHPRLSRLPGDRLTEEMLRSKSDIEKNVSSKKCMFFAYPFGDCDRDVMAQAREVYAASRLGGVDCGLNEVSVDFARVRGCSPDDGNDIYLYTDEAERHGQWLVAIFHSLDGAKDCYGSWTFGDWTAYLDYLETKNLWVATFGEAVKYIRERMAAKVTVEDDSSDRIRLTLTDSLDDATYDQPLTIRSDVPSGWEVVFVRQGKSIIGIQPVREGDESVVYYEAVPDRGPITLRDTIE